MYLPRLVSSMGRAGFPGNGSGSRTSRSTARRSSVAVPVWKRSTRKVWGAAVSDIARRSAGEIMPSSVAGGAATVRATSHSAGGPPLVTGEPITFQGVASGPERGLLTGHEPERSRAAPSRRPPAGPPRVPPVDARARGVPRLRHRHRDHGAGARPALDVGPGHAAGPGHAGALSAPI